jgi:hypothetical protein
MGAPSSLGLDHYSSLASGLATAIINSNSIFRYRYGRANPNALSYSGPVAAIVVQLFLLVQMYCSEMLESPEAQRLGETIRNKPLLSVFFSSEGVDGDRPSQLLEC